ncbi:MAG: hypothetical protein H7X97_07100 [Opitutaceae bacterium]|nr:hypothetical protein [Verrucomicrobiales bacterium]
MAEKPIKLKSRFSYKQVKVGASPTLVDFNGEFIAFYSTTGLFDIRLNDGDDWLPGYAGMILRLDGTEKFTHLFFRSSSTATVSFYYGVGEITLPANLGGNMQVYIGSSDDPNGVVTPADPANAAMYYKDQASPVVLWHWSVSSQNWFNSLS